MAPPCKKVRMLCGDYMEDYEAAVPFCALAALGVAVDCVAPGKAPGDACLTAVHDFLGFELYTELPGHRFAVTADFRALAGVGCRVEAACPTKRKGEACFTAIYDAAAPGAAVSDEKCGHNFAVTADWYDVDVDQYDFVVVPGGRAPELLVTHDKAVALVSEFAAKGKVVSRIDQGHLLLSAAGLLNGKNCASGVAMRVIANLAGAASVQPNSAVADGKLVTAASCPDLPKFLAHIIILVGITVSF